MGLAFRSDLISIQCKAGAELCHPPVQPFRLCGFHHLAENVDQVFIGAEVDFHFLLAHFASQHIVEGVPPSIRFPFMESRNGRDPDPDRDDEHVVDLRGRVVIVVGALGHRLAPPRDCDGCENIRNRGYVKTDIR